MKPGRILFSLAILLGLLAGTAVPVAHAQTPAVITFHVYANTGFIAPEDVEETIISEGTLVTDQTGSGVLMLQNLCEGTDCTSQDIYYKISLVITWTSDWGHDYPTWNVAPFPHYHLGGMNLPPIETGYCGGPTGEVGSCVLEIEGTIPANEISTDPDVAHETFMLSYGANYGGLDISAVYSLTFSTSPILNTEAPCSGQYNIGAAIGTAILPATASTGINMLQALGSAAPNIGDYYVVEVSGSWKNNNTGPDLRDVGMEVFSSNPTWYSLGTNPTVECVDVDTYYLQMWASPASMFFRVYDNDGDFASNTGSLTLAFYAVAARTRYPSGCELQYETGDFIEQKTVNAAWPNGWPLDTDTNRLPWNPNAVGGEGGSSAKRYYMLETLGGPAYLGVGLTYGADLGLRTSWKDTTPDLWYEIHTAPFVDCVIQTDTIGHVKVYFAMDEKTDVHTFLEYYYVFRVRDTGSYADNSGTLSYRLYQATFLQSTTPGLAPTATGCDQFSHEATAASVVTILGNSASGSLVTGLTPGGIFALEVSGGPWKDNGVNKYDIEISDDNGNTWTDLKDYSNLLCASSADGDHVMIYLYGASGKTWRARANDPSGSYPLNSLSINLNVYAGLTKINEFITCGDDYSLTSMLLGEEARKIPGDSASGIPVTLTAGTIYAIEITDASKWYEAGAGVGSYLVDISDDNGATWKHLESYSSLCAAQIGDGDRYKVYFTATTNLIQLRVRDGDSNFNSNSGWVIFDIYSAKNTANPPASGPGSTGTPPPEWVVACNETYSRPNGWITWYPLGTILSVPISVPIPRVGEWIDYLRSAITFYFAWCPQHTEALKSIGQVYMEREPMASIDGLMNFVKSIQTLLAGYQTVGGEDPLAPSQEPSLFSDTGNIGMAGGGDTLKAPSSALPWDIFMIGNVDTSTSVWYGGQIDLAASLGSTNLNAMNTYKTMCNGKFYPLFGIGTNPFCNLMAMMRWSSVMTWILLGIDFFVMLWFLLAYLPGFLRRLWGLISGNKQLVGKVINKL